MKVNNKGFFSVIISLFAIAYLLFTVGVPHNTPNYYPEFIVKTEIQYLYLNNTITQQISEFIDSNPGCAFNIVNFKSYLESNQSVFCDGFNTDSFKCDIDIKQVAQKFGLISVVLSVKNKYNKSGLNFGYTKDYLFSKVVELNTATIPLPDGTEQKTCSYSITDLDSGIVEKEGNKN